MFQLMSHFGFDSMFDAAIQGCMRVASLVFMLIATNTLSLLSCQL